MVASATGTDVVDDQDPLLQALVAVGVQQTEERREFDEMPWDGPWEVSEVRCYQSGVGGAKVEVAHCSPPIRTRRAARF